MNQLEKLKDWIIKNDYYFDSNTIKILDKEIDRLQRAEDNEERFAVFYEEGDDVIQESIWMTLEKALNYAKTDTTNKGFFILKRIKEV